MRVDDVRQRLALIEAEAKARYPKYDKLHRWEDRVHAAVMQSIADGTCEDPQGCAREVMKTFEIEFDRWYS